MFFIHCFVSRFLLIEQSVWEPFCLIDLTRSISSFCSLSWSQSLSARCSSVFSAAHLCARGCSERKCRYLPVCVAPATTAFDYLYEKALHSGKNWKFVKSYWQVQLTSKMITKVHIFQQLQGHTVWNVSNQGMQMSWRKYAWKTSHGHWHSGVVSPKFGGGAKCLILGEQQYFYLRCQFSKPKMTRYAKHLEGHDALGPLATPMHWLMTYGARLAL